MNKGLKILKKIPNPILQEKFTRMEKQEQYNSNIKKVIQTQKVLVQDFNKNKMNIMNSQNILYVCDFDEYNKINHITSYFQNCCINIFFLVLHNKTIFLTESDNIIIIDINREQDLCSYERYILNKLDITDTIVFAIDNDKYKSNILLTNISNNFRNIIVMPYSKISSMVNKKIKIFINFKCINESYGGGNQFVNNMHKYLEKCTNVTITYELEQDINVYLIIDPRKDKNFKKYSLGDIVKYRNANEQSNSKIIYRVNDCDITREIKNLECYILEHVNNIDCFVYNSDFIKQYYHNKYPQMRQKMARIIYNSVDGSIFYPKQDSKLNKKIKIVTHHWSDNINKGYDIYFRLSEYCKISNLYEFVFIGRKFNQNYDTKSIIVSGPFCGMELADNLRKCDIYITASKYDSCPMHVLEGISCGLPILYSDNIGGATDICEIGQNKIGEKFASFDDLINKLELIRNNYNCYCENIKQNINMYNSNECYAKYLRLMHHLE